MLLVYISNMNQMKTYYTPSQKSATLTYRARHKEQYNEYMKQYMLKYEPSQEQKLRIKKQFADRYLP